MDLARRQKVDDATRRSPGTRFFAHFAPLASGKVNLNLALVVFNQHMMPPTLIGTIDIGCLGPALIQLKLILINLRTNFTPY